MNEVVRMNYAPHRTCFLNDANLILLHRVSDAVIAFSYYVIPLALVLLLLRRNDELAFRARVVLVITAAFILACGTTHIMNFWNVTHTNYWIEGWVKAATAAVSLPAAAIYIIGLKWFLSFKHPLRLLESVMNLKLRLDEYEKSKADLAQLGRRDPAVALQLAHVQRLESEHKMLKLELDNLVRKETR